MTRVLFICTGNYYRSRFAEALFNHHAAEAGLDWSAFSRGLAVHLAERELSVLIIEALRQRVIEQRHTAPLPVQLCEDDLRTADLVIALDATEHRPMVRRQFPDWERRMHYWEVADVGLTPAEEALPRIEALVLDLLAALRQGNVPPSAGHSGR